MKTEFVNSLLYFFSVVPQILGALMALLSVFLLFKFQSLNKSIISFGEQILLRLDNESFLSSIKDRHLRLLKGNLREGIMRHDMETVVSQISAINQTLAQINIESELLSDKDLEVKYEKNGLIQSFKISESIQWKCLELKDNLTRKIKQFLFVCVGLILFSICCLPLVPILICNEYTTLLLLICLFVLIGFAKCLKDVIWMIIISLSHDYNDEKMSKNLNLFTEIKSLFISKKKV